MTRSQKEEVLLRSTCIYKFEEFSMYI
uniref:Uncharacterized protein n=1 Tax=Arundo donax TaxID=35708 RepID=A0A0A9BF69_ARUDO